MLQAFIDTLKTMKNTKAKSPYEHVGDGYLDTLFPVNVVKSSQVNSIEAIRATCQAALPGAEEAQNCLINAATQENREEREKLAQQGMELLTKRYITSL
jgi:hypothetical protein